MMKLLDRRLNENFMEKYSHNGKPINAFFNYLVKNYPFNKNVNSSTNQSNTKRGLITLDYKLEELINPNDLPKETMRISINDNFNEFFEISNQELTNYNALEYTLVSENLEKLKQDLKKHDYLEYPDSIGFFFFNKSIDYLNEIKDNSSFLLKIQKKNWNLDESIHSLKFYLDVNDKYFQKS